MIVVCGMWCDSTLIRIDPSGPLGAVSHSVCSDCRARWLRELTTISDSAIEELRAGPEVTVISERK